MPAATAERFRLLYELGSAFAARMELDELVPLIVNKCRDVMGTDGASVALLDPTHQELYFPYVASGDPAVAERLRTARFPATHGIAGSVVQSGHAVRVDDVSQDVRFYGGVDRHTGSTTRSLLCAPLATHQGVIGAIQVVNRLDGRPFTDDDLAFLDALAGSVAVAIENARLFSAFKDSAERLKAQVGVLRSDLARRDRSATLVGSAQPMHTLFRLIERAAAAPIPVLIEGETGTGKELVARAIHAESPRAEGPFVPVNCAALPEALIESTLFGHRRGAFTGAVQDHRGLFEAAAGGTIFLDEIGEMPLALQAKLLRVLQDHEIVPVGDTRGRTVDVRVISATNRDLAELIAAHTFRDDLYYRVAGFPIRVPPLRDRPEDIPLLTQRFLRVAATTHGKHVAGITEAGLAVLAAHTWPGNVRELQNEVERAVVLVGPDEWITPGHFSARLRPAFAGANASIASPGTSVEADRPLRQARAEFERAFIAAALARHAGNVSQTAPAIGLSRAMLQRKMRDYKLR
jgi:transcriptional regulator with GAF, ATPase, and Fis domain